MKPAGQKTVAVNKKVPQKTGIRHLLRKYRLALLLLVPLAVYARVATLEYICIDDYHFIVNNKAYLQDLSNVFTAFERGLFQPADKSIYDYYRPLFLVDMIVEYQLFGGNATGYHITNLLFHILSVVLLYLFFKRIKLENTTSLILALLFAVHPAISMAVAWIPGRNDMILMIFLLAAMIFAIDFSSSRRWHHYILQALFFLLAIFTKETAIIFPLLAGWILVSVMKTGWKSLFPLISGWLAVIVAWFVMESMVKQSGNRFPVDEMIQSGLGRVPALLQYLGKVVFPLNLSVHPQINEISNVWGILAVAGIAALVIYSRSYRKPLTIIGAAWFLLFLLPVLAVPRTFSDLVYEHRLYVPLVGILLLLSQSALLNGKMKERYRSMFFGTIILVFGVMSFIRTGYFKSPLSYWSRVVAETPGNAYSLQMMGTWVKDDAEQEKLFRQAYAIDPALQDINLNLGKVAYKQKHLDEAETFLKNELTLPTPKDPENYFLLGRIAYEKKNYSDVKRYMPEGIKIAGSGDAEVYSLLAKAYFIENSLDSAAINLRKVTALDPANSQAYYNLVVIYMKMGERDSAAAELQKIRMYGLKVPPELAKLVGEQENPDAGNR